MLVTGERSKLEGLAGGGAEVHLLGEAGGDRLAIESAESSCDVLLEDAGRAWRSLPDRLGQ